MLFDNTTGGMKNLPAVIFIPMLGIKILMVVLFNMSIRNSRAYAHVRIHKVFYPCNRCHLATLSDNQYVTCGNEVTRVTTNGVFAPKMSEKTNEGATSSLRSLRHRQWKLYHAELQSNLVYSV